MGWSLQRAKSNQRELWFTEPGSLWSARSKLARYYLHNRGKFQVHIRCSVAAYKYAHTNTCKSCLCQRFALLLVIEMSTTVWICFNVSEKPVPWSRRAWFYTCTDHRRIRRFIPGVKRTIAKFVITLLELWLQSCLIEYDFGHPWRTIVSYIWI